MDGRVKVHAFDTFEGMTRPTDIDVDSQGKSAVKTFERLGRSDVSSDWAHASLEQVREAMAGTGYDEKRIHFVKGPVEQTLPREAPEAIAVLRLDTDWYESTLHEMVHL